VVAEKEKKKYVTIAFRVLQLINVAITQVTNYNLASNSYVKTSPSTKQISRFPLKPFGVAVMSKTVYIESTAQFSSLISSSSIVVADCKYAPPLPPFAFCQLPTQTG
jgi:hypothetical protein